MTRGWNTHSWKYEENSSLSVQELTRIGGSKNEATAGGGKLGSSQENF